jgi:hypothetical protein
VCVAIGSSNANCGACGNACPGGTTCVGGSCLDSTGLRCPSGDKLCPATNQCTDLRTDGDCGACGNTCMGGATCQPTATDGGGSQFNCACPAGTTFCNGVCVDLTSNPFHCGACTNKCNTGQVCSNSACAAMCASGQSLCGGACVNVATDERNCGGCGATCAYGQECMGGTCTNVCTAGNYCGFACDGTTAASCCISFNSQVKAR